jgi:hypothetical protein
MGMATANISNGVNGTVMSFGTLTGLDTRGSTASAIAVGDETWAEGDILYAHPTVDGKLTKVRPQHDLAVAFITVRHASSGQIAIRIVPGNNHLEWLHDVALNAPADNEVLAFDSASGLWKNQTAAEAGLAPSTIGSWTLAPGANTVSFTVDWNFTYSMWVFIDDMSYKSGQWKHIMHKGNSTSWPNRAPGIWIHPTENKLRVYTNTYKNIAEFVDVENIPINKWFHLAVAVRQQDLDIYMNGNLLKRKRLEGLVLPLHQSDV